jgi:hypothetical protein
VLVIFQEKGLFHLVSILPYPGWRNNGVLGSIPAAFLQRGIGGISGLDRAGVR